MNEVTPETTRIETVQWAPSGNALEGVPSEVVRLLATAEGKTFGYGYGAGWAMVFGSERGGVSIEPGQWVTRYADGRVEVTDQRPEISIPSDGESDG